MMDRLERHGIFIAGIGMNLPGAAHGRYYSDGGPAQRRDPARRAKRRTARAARRKNRA